MHHSPIRRDLSFLSFLKLFLCLAATFSGLSSPIFQMLSPCFGRPLFGMADWGRKSAVSLSPLVGGGKRRPRGVVGSIPSGSPCLWGIGLGKPPGAMMIVLRAHGFLWSPGQVWLEWVWLEWGRKRGWGWDGGARSLFPFTPFSLIVGPSSLSACVWLWVRMTCFPLSPQGSGETEPGASKARQSSLGA